MKISLITVTYNAEEFLESCIKSVICQTYNDLEYIIVDGKSSDYTIDIIRKFGKNINQLLIEPDLGIYDAMNKGISLATGDIIGILNADDYLENERVIEKIAQTFSTYKTDILYGNLNYVKRYNTLKVVRKWRSKPFDKNLFDAGWMPAHPTFYARKELFVKYGNYRLKYGSAADYELMVRFLYKYNATATFLDEVVVNMRDGGISNNSLRNRLNASYNDLKAMIANGIRFPYIAVILKPIQKIIQYL
ncbi:MAG: glycosyltransferase [Sphingobacteriales bacterium]|nr:glycosyltransferase [Sphingobacteriales bacterium]